MKVIILAGGKGTRISEYTKTIPKPMIKIGKKPILIHIIQHYSKYGHREFFIALGHKSQIVKNYFNKFKKLDEAFDYRLKNFNVSITLSYTGENTFTGGRIKKMAKFINTNEDFMFTYGDGVSNVDIKKLVQFHKKNKKLITVTAVRPPARFGEITIKNNRVNTFKEKPQVTTGWINGGFFVSNYNFFKLIKNDSTILEREPLEQASKKNQLYAFKHKGFWKCMDTLRDKEVLEKIYKQNKFN
jgi:glucose-1-phosphate cytidylyltransferase|tara:strand:+ start:1169 stop:1897 length:729 start_codon:yes stop_codon:yes gene_type:complete